MAVPISNVTRRQVYAPSGAGGAGPYAFTFEILANTDIAVYKDDVLLTLTTHYTVVINANGTGSVTITAAGLALAPASPTQYAIVGNRTISRTTDFTTGGDFFANVLNDELDQQTIFAQQNAEGLQRALQAPQTDPTSINMTLPRASDRANKTLNFDANGNPIAGLTVTANAAANVATWLGTPSSANLRAAMTDETGTGALVFADAPTFSGNPIFSAGTANGVAYLNGSKVLTTGSALTFDGTNLGLGGAPVAVGSSPVLEIYSGANNGILKFTNSTTGTTNSDGTWLYQPAGSNNFIVQNQESAGDLRLFSTTHIWGNHNYSTEYMRLTSTGLGIGTSSPGVRLQIGNPSDSNQALRFDFTDSSTARINSTRVGSGNLQSLLLAGQDTLQFSTAGSERARIDSSGNLLVGTTTTGFTNSRSFTFQGVGDGKVYINHSTLNGNGDGFIGFGYNGGQIGSITQSGTTAVAYNTSSDYRLKEISSR